VFRTPAGDYGVDRGSGQRGSRSSQLDDVAPRARSLIYYGHDRWDHEILVEEVLAAEPGVAYPRCLAGRRVAPGDAGVDGFDVDGANRALAGLARVLT
jgi:hypothetical protein